MGNTETKNRSKFEDALTFTMDTNSDRYIKQRYFIGWTLGEGATSRVLEVTEISTGKKFALKVINKSSTQNQANFERETNILKTLCHPNIMAYERSHSDSSHFYILTELCEGGDLLDRLIDPNFYMTERKACRLIRSMLLAVQHCHLNNIVHRYLQPENYAFKTKVKDSEVLLIDFGCAKVVQDDRIYHGVIGTPYYLAPEVVAGRRMIRTGRTLKCSDIWSIGVIAYIMMTGVYPFSGSTRTAIFKSILYSPLTFPNGATKWSNSFKDFCKRALVKCPNQRMTVLEALKHPWVQGRFTSPDVLQSTIARVREPATVVYSLESGSHVYQFGQSMFMLGTCPNLEDVCKSVYV